MYNKITLQNQIFTDTDLSQITEKKMVNVLFNTVPFKEIITCLSLNLGVFLKGNYRKREEHVRILENYDLLKKFDKDTSNYKNQEDRISSSER